MLKTHLGNCSYIGYIFIATTLEIMAKHIFAVVLKRNNLEVLDISECGITGRVG